MQSKTVFRAAGLLLCLAPAALAAGTNATLAALTEVTFGKFFNCSLAAKGERTYCKRNSTVDSITSICTYDCGLLGACKDDVVGHLLKPTLIQCGGGGPATPTFPDGCSAAQVTLGFEEALVGLNSTGMGTPQPADGNVTEIDPAYFAYDNVVFLNVVGRRSLASRTFVYPTAPTSTSNQNFANGKANLFIAYDSTTIYFPTAAKVSSIYVGSPGAPAATNITTLGGSPGSANPNCTSNNAVSGDAGITITFSSCVANFFTISAVGSKGLTLTLDDITACQAMVPSFGP